MSPRWGSIEQSNVIYKNSAPLELKGSKARRLQEGILYSSPSGATFL